MVRQSTELLRSDEFNRRISSSSPDGILALDRAGQVVSINRSGLAMLDAREADTLVGLPWMSTWPEGDPSREHAQKALESALARRPGRLRASTARRTGMIRHWDVVVAPILGSDGEVDRILAVYRETTEQQNAQAAIAASDKRRGLQAALRADVTAALADHRRAAADAADLRRGDDPAMAAWDADLDPRGTPPRPWWWRPAPVPPPPAMARSAASSWGRA